MTKEQYDDMMEFAKEDINTVTDYLEVNYDDLAQEDICMLYRVFVEEEPETEDKEEVHAALLDVLYEMAEEHPKNMMKLAQKVKNYLEK